MTSGPADDEGSATIFFVVFILFAFLLAGLVVDGGLAIDARQRAADAAEQAARVGADNIDVAHLRDTGEPLIDNGVVNGELDACRKAGDLLGSYGGVQRSGSPWCSLSADRKTITVRTKTKVSTDILSIMGFDSFTVGAKAVAHPVAG